MEEGSRSGPHEALFHALGYVGLPGLLALRMVCRSFRDAVEGDALLWRHVAVEAPLSCRLTDAHLLKLASKAQGTLRTLALISCSQVTDDVLYRLALSNPHITKLHIPGCTGLTPAGVVRVVERLSHLKQLRLNGLPNVNKEHLDRLNSLLGTNPQPQLMFYNGLHCSQSGIDDHPIDIGICPKCKHSRLVFDCPREQCQRRRLHCRGCFFCIARCAECGGCIEGDDLLAGTVCIDLLCSECWLQLPKCQLCNRPSCHRHLHLLSGGTNSSGFTCERCNLESGNSSPSTYMELV